MGVLKILTPAVNAIFGILVDAVKDGQYVVKTDDGFGNTSEDKHQVRVILDNFTQHDVEHTSFSDLIQPTDTKGLVPGEDVPVAMNTVNLLEVSTEYGVRIFNIVAYDIDPMSALYTLLLRDNR